MKLKIEQQIIWNLQEKISINSDELWELRIESSSFSKRKEEFQAGDVLGPNWKKLIPWESINTKHHSKLIFGQRCQHILNSLKSTS